MELPTDLTPILGGTFIRLDGSRLKQLNQPTLLKAIDKMGELSASALFIQKPITTCERLMASPDHALYVMWEKGEAPNTSTMIGYIKVGPKSLFVFDRKQRSYQGKTMCVLDFYIHYSKQRQGFGRQLFEFMLQHENAVPEGLALDNPSETMLAFMSKHFQLTDPIWQNTNFVIYSTFIDILGKANAKEDGRPSTPRPAEPRDAMNSSMVGDLTAATLASRSQACKQRKQHILGHQTLW